MTRTMSLLIAGIATLAAMDNESSKLAVPSGSPTDPGHGELGLGLERHRVTRTFDDSGSAVDRGGDAADTALGASLTIGVVEGIDVAVGVDYHRLRDEASDPDSGSGLGDLGLGATFRLAQGEHWVVGLLPHIELPIHGDPPDDELATSSDDPTWGVDIAATWESGAFIGSATTGFTRNTGDSAEASDGTIWLGAAVGITVQEWLQPEIDLVYERDLLADDGPGWALIGFIGAQFPTEYWRGSVGLSRTLAGRLADEDAALSGSITWLW